MFCVFYSPRERVDGEESRFYAVINADSGISENRRAAAAPEPTPGQRRVEPVGGQDTHQPGKRPSAVTSPKGHEVGPPVADGAEATGSNEAGVYRRGGSTTGRPGGQPADHGASHRGSAE
jgi:hypothetical protein